MDVNFEIEFREIYSLKSNEKVELINFANKIGTLLDGYLEERFSLYGHVIILKSNNQVGSFQFIEYLDENDEIYIYFGPLFSKMSRFLTLFLDFFRKSVGEVKGKKIHLLAEIQNPEVFLVFKALFGSYSYPQINQKFVPDEVRRIAEFFSSKLSHMSRVNLDNLSTKSRESLYNTKPHLQEVNYWLLKRGIDLAKGDNVLLIVTVPNEQLEREALFTQLNKGIALTMKWREGKLFLLQQFQEGV